MPITSVPIKASTKSPFWAFSTVPVIFCWVVDSVLLMILSPNTGKFTFKTGCSMLVMTW
nr:hypothetical protein [Simonsiella muelleri]